METVKVLQLGEMGGRLTVTLQRADGAVSTLPCKFGPLRDWRLKKSDAEIVRLLAGRIVRVEIQSGTIVSMQTSASTSSMMARSGRPRGSAKPTTGAPKHGSKTAAGASKSPRAARWRHGRKPVRTAEPQVVSRSLGPRICPNCHSVVRPTEQRQGGKRVYRCPKCYYPVGYS